jgi:hypothetical protein
MSTTTGPSDSGPTIRILGDHRLPYLERGADACVVDDGDLDQRTLGEKLTPSAPGVIPRQNQLGWSISRMRLRQRAEAGFSSQPRLPHVGRAQAT